MLPVDCPKQLVEQFKKQARKAFPNETLAYLIGQVVGDHVYIDSLWSPEDVDEYCDHTTVFVQPEWNVEAIEVAKEREGEVVGTIHSHPWTKEEIEATGGTPSMGQSEADIESCGLFWQQISGICLVAECKSGRLKSYVKFWGPTVPLDVKLTAVNTLHCED